MALSGQSLDFVNVPTIGKEIVPDTAKLSSKVTMVLQVQNSNSGPFQMDLEASFDGITWINVGAFSWPVTGSWPAYMTPGSGGAYPINASARLAIERAGFNQFRANLVSFTQPPGGTMAVNATLYILPD